MNTGAPWPSLTEAKARVLEIQTKLHRWAGEHEGRQLPWTATTLAADPAALHSVETGTSKGVPRAVDPAGPVENAVVFTTGPWTALRADTQAPQPLRLLPLTR